MRENDLPATSGGSFNYRGWLYVASVLGGGISHSDWQDLNEFEMEAIIQETNRYNEDQNKKYREETESLTKQFNSKNNAPPQGSMFNELSIPAHLRNNNG